MNLQSTLGATPSSPLGKKRTVLLLRTVVVLSTGYLILFGPNATDPFALGYIAALLASNLALGMTPDRWFYQPAFSAVLLLGDTLAVLVGLYLTVGCFSQDFLIIYFFTIFLTTATQSIAQIAVGAALISGVYGYWLALTAGHVLTTGEWLRLPFFFIVAVFYAYVTEETKAERWRREQAERERERLRCLLSMADPMASEVLGREWVTQVCGAVEAAFPRLVCQLSGIEPVGMAGVRWFAVRGRDEAYGGLIVTARDGTALSASEEQFCTVVALMAGHILGESKTASEEANVRLRQEFLGTLSHELRTPLHAILGYAEMMETCLAESAQDRAHDVLGRLRANAGRLQDLLGEMLWFAELRSGERNLHPEAVGLQDIFAEERNLIADQLVGRPIELHFQVDEAVPQLTTDRRKLMQVVRCLISNALKFTEAGEVRVHAQRLDTDRVEITVSDTGIGIPQHHFESIFQEFRQIDASSTRRAGGVGLGLALARELVTLLGGAIEVDSRPGQGTIFHVVIPIGLPSHASVALDPRTSVAAPCVASA